MLRKLLTRTALVGFGVRQHARRESISKRAPSTTRTSLRFRIKALRAVSKDYCTRRRLSRPFLGSCLHSASLTRSSLGGRRNCVRPLDVPRSLTSITRARSVQLQQRGLSPSADNLQRIERTLFTLRTRRCLLCARRRTGQTRLACSRNGASADIVRVVARDTPTPRPAAPNKVHKSLSFTCSQRHNHGAGAVA
jgi:hypothetical protein